MSLNGTQVHLVNNTADSWRFICWLTERMQDPDAVLAYDLETTGLDPRADGAAIRLAQLGDEKDGWAFPWDHWSGPFMEALSVWDKALVGHNTSFDNRWLMLHAGWRPPFERVHDTMIMAQIAEPHLNAGLKDLCDRHIDPRASVGQILLKQAMKEQGWTWATVPVDFDVYWKYGCIDTIITALLYRHYRVDIKYPESYELEMATRRIVSEMEDNGIVIDLEYCQEWYDKLKAHVGESKQWAIDNWGTNILASGQVVKLFQSMGQEFTKFSAKTGAPSADEEQLLLFAESGDENVQGVVDFILTTKKMDKKANTYFKNFLNLHHGGRLHASFHTLRARTGRMSSSTPNLQNIGKVDVTLRDAFLPNEGEVLLSCDYSQVELRLMCHFSGDAQLQEAFRTADATGGDFFVEMGKTIYRDPNFSKKDPRRGLIKTFMYAYLYGAGLEKMAKSAGVSPQEMTNFVRDLGEAYPGIPQFQQNVITLGEQREAREGHGYVLTPTGRKIPCDRGEARTLVNYILQGTAAEILKKALVRLDAAGLTQYLILPIHDEVIASVPVDRYEEIAREISDIMSVRGEFAVDLIAEAEGPFTRWGDKIRGGE